MPAVTFVEECDFTGADLSLPRAARAEGGRRGAAGVPRAERAPRGDEIVYLERYDLGLAVQTDQGLVVPVVRGCDSASIEELAAEAARLAEAAGPGR